MSGDIPEGSFFREVVGAAGPLSIGDICTCCIFPGTLNFFVIIQFFRVLSGQVIAFCRPAKEDGGRIVDVSSESQLSCPLSSLEPSRLKATGRVQRAIFSFTEEAGRSSIECQLSQSANVEYLRQCRSFFLGALLWDFVKKTLNPAGDCLVRSFQFRLADFDLEILGLSSAGHAAVHRLESGFTSLDELLGTRWDYRVIDTDNPSSLYWFVREVKLRLLLSSKMVNCRVTRCRSNSSWTATYRNDCLDYLNSA